MTIAAAGNVGIGSINPSKPLDVAGMGKFTTAGGTDTLTLYDASYTNLVLGKHRLVSATAAEWLQFRNYDNSSTWMTILDGGNVGIGTDGPTVELDVVGTGIFSSKVGIGTSPTNALDVMGHLTATSKSFLIDHPTKENKKLQYASLEGPENAIYVRGTHNSSLIELPEYWSELVHEDSLTVALTPLGKHQNLYVKSKDTNHISVGGVKGSYDYVVYGERKDIDKLEVEPPKV
jgi:hypothetical protein